MAELRVPSLNLVVLAGRLVNDPELRFTPSGRPVTSFRLAANRRYQVQGGEWQDESLFIDVVTWGDLAQRVAETMRKGRAVVVQGRLRQRSWETEAGQRRSTYEIVALSVMSLERATETVPEAPPEAEGTVEPDIPPVEEGTPDEEDLPF